MQIVPISAGFGATVCDVAFAQFSADEFRRLDDVFRHYSVLAFPAGEERGVA